MKRKRKLSEPVGQAAQYNSRPASASTQNQLTNLKKKFINYFHDFGEICCLNFEMKIELHVKSEHEDV